MTDWARLREEFPILADTAYLNACSLGPMPRRAAAALQRYAEEWDMHGSQAWFVAWMPVLQRLRERVGELLRTPASSVALAPSVSAALLVMANALLARTRRRKVLVGRLDFPTVGYQFLSRPDLRVEFVESEDGITIPPEAFAERIDEDTALVATTHVLFTTGYLQDVAALAEAAHRRGAALLVDGYHSVGCVPVDLGALGCDVFVGGSLKFLSGGPGTAFIACRPDLVDQVHPVGTGWMGTRDFLSFRVDQAVPEDDARRFETGTWAMPAHCAALAALELVLEVGVENIANRLHDLTDAIIERCDEAGLCVRTPRGREGRGGFVSVACADPEPVERRLREERVIVDSRPGLLRLSPHWALADEQLHRALDLVVRELAGARIP
jgi:kynureninase